MRDSLARFRRRLGPAPVELPAPGPPPARPARRSSGSTPSARGRPGSTSPRCAAASEKLRHWARPATAGADSPAGPASCNPLDVAVVPLGARPPAQPPAARCASSARPAAPAGAAGRRHDAADRRRPGRPAAGRAAGSITAWTTSASGRASTGSRCGGWKSDWSPGPTCSIAVSETLRERLAGMGRDVPPADARRRPRLLGRRRAGGTVAGAGRAWSGPLVVFWGVIDRRMDVAFVRRLAADLTAGRSCSRARGTTPTRRCRAARACVRLPPLPFDRLPALARRRPCWSCPTPTCR